MTFWKFTLATAALVLSNSANAALIDNATYFTDTDSNLDWLKLTETLSRSYNDVNENFGLGGDYEGWQFANSEQFENLMIGQSITPMTGCYGGLSFCGSPVNGQAAIDEIVELFGDIGERYTRGRQTEGYHGYNYGYIADKNTTSTINDANYIALVSSTTDSIRTYASWDETDVSGNPVRGSYLVRTSVVPLPAAIWLFSSGLIGLISFARRKKAYK